MTIQTNSSVNAGNTSLASPRAQVAIRAISLLDNILIVKESGITLIKQGQELIDQGDVQNGEALLAQAQRRIEAGQNELERVVQVCSRFGIKVPTKYFKVS